jgi:16S rRNA (guanine966-N2)-methyltransferase
VKIISGRWKGKELFSPEGKETRPTLQRVKENIFNILHHAPWMIPFEEVRVLDLFAGTGQMGFEALSRGAKRACFVDNAVSVRGILRKNIEILHAEGITKIYSRSALDLDDRPHTSGGPFNLVFIDAPYKTGMGSVALKAALDQKWLCADTVVCMEIDAQEPFEVVPDGFFMQEDRTYGTCRLVFLTSFPQ